MEFTKNEISVYFAERVPGLKQTDVREWRGPCPIHQGMNPSLSINSETGFAHCHSKCGRGWDMLGFEIALTGKTFSKAKEDVFRTIGRPAIPWQERDVEAIYVYTDAAGNPRYRVLRKTGKRFSQQRPDGKGGWEWGLGGATPLPFRLPAVLKADIVFLCEGEKDVLTMERLGFTASCNSGGAGKFHPDLAPHFTGKNLGILFDNDDKGRAHAVQEANMLKPVTKSVRIVELPGLTEKGDVSDFVAAGGTAEQIMEHYQAATEWTADWEFSAQMPNSADRYVKRFSDVVADYGGPDGFWDVTTKSGIPTPFPRLTKALAGGLRSSEVYVIGGNQGSGKTSLLLQFLLTAIRLRLGVLLFSMEMSHRDVYHRLCAILAHVDLLEFGELQGNNPEADKYKTMCRELARAAAEIEDLPLLVSTKPSITPDLIVEESRRLSKQQKIDLIAVDHMQLMSTTASVRGDYERFTAISRALKQTAMELSIPVLVVSQTSRNNSKDKRSELEVHDLRGSGAIEEDAAAVMLVYPDPEDRKRSMNDGTFARGSVKSWLKLGKNRYGLQDMFLPLLHVKSTTQFAELHYGKSTSV